MLQRVEDPSDAELISAVRGGDGHAYGELFTRHVDAARRLARQLMSPSDADDLVSEAFAKVLRVLQGGGGPDLAFRAYLLTAVRRLHVDRIRATSRLHTTDDMESFDPGVPFRDTAVEGFENAAAARAFASLPERWQLVLWHTEVEGQKPAEVATLLGISANSVSALAYRAREGLRQAFLTMHAQDIEDDGCEWTRQNLGAYIRNGISRRDAGRVEDHLGECRKCAAVYLELTEVNSNLSGLLAPLLLGGAAAGYLGAASGAAAQGGLLVLLNRAWDVVTANAPASAAAGVAVTVVAGGAVFLALDREQPPPAADAPAAERSDRRPGPQRTDEGGRRKAEELQPSRDTTSAQASSGPIGTTSQSTAPSATPPGDPTTAPAPDQPEAPPGPGKEKPPGQDDPDDPDDEEKQPPPSDLRVGATSTRQGSVHDVVVRVAGLADGAAGTLSVSGSGVVVMVTRDQRCQPRVLDGSCRIASSPTTFSFRAVAPQGGSLTFTVDSGAPDADPSNNRATVTLAP